MTGVYLAFDFGTTGTKSALIDRDGRTLRTAYRAYATHTEAGGVVEQQVADWWEAVIGATHDLAAETESVGAIALTGQMQDLILLDAAGDAVRPVILYSDSRAHHEAAHLNAQVGAERLEAVTGNAQDAGSLLAKLRWLLQHEPTSVTRSAHLLVGAADVIAMRLTGAAVSDTTTASTTGLLDITTRRTLETAFLMELGLSAVERLLPTPTPGGARVGTLTAEAAGVLGLRAGLPVHHGPGDAGATTLGVGSGEPGAAYAYIGMSGWVAFTGTQRITGQGRVFTLAHPRADQYITIAPLLTAGGNLDWARALFGVDDHAALIAEALDHPPSSLLYLPYLNGERSPFSDPFARGAFIGLNPRHTRADLCRAVLEGVIYAYRHALSTLIADPLTRLTLTGGGTRSERWCQLFADITGVPVALAGDAEHVGVRGAVLAAQVAAGERRDYAPAGFFPLAETLTPDNAHHAHYERQFVLFKASYPALKPIFAELG
jgi:xylulokinase